MIHLSLLEILLEFLKIRVYDKYIENSFIFEKCRLIIFNQGYEKYIDSLKEIIQQIEDFIIKMTPNLFLKYIRTGLITFRYMCNVRLLVTFIPNINPWRSPWAMITEPVDLILRPLCWRIPRIAYLDITNWVVFFVLNSLIDILNFLVKMSDMYHKIK